MFMSRPKLVQFMIKIISFNYENKVFKQSPAHSIYDQNGRLYATLKKRFTSGTKFTLFTIKINSQDLKTKIYVCPIYDKNPSHDFKARFTIHIQNGLTWLLLRHSHPLMRRFKSKVNEQSGACPICDKITLMYFEANIFKHSQALNDQSPLWNRGLQSDSSPPDMQMKCTHSVDTNVNKHDR